MSDPASPPQVAPLDSAPSDLLDALPVASTSAAQPAPKVKRAGAQPLADQLLGNDGLIAEQIGRHLTADKEMWDHNAWDNVGWDDEQQAIALAKVEKQRLAPVDDDLRKVYNEQPHSYWDAFYASNKDGFFNDRKWLRTEFPELAKATQADAGPQTIVEIGCGPGNTLFPLFEGNENPELQLHGYDFSKEAVDLVKANPLFDSKHLHSGVWNLASPEGLPAGLEHGSVDIAIMIFVTSALHPDEWAQAVKNTCAMLKPGGLLLFRDYGRHDMAQLRFKGNRFMQPNLYIRGDKTRVYFFERDELVAMFGSATPSSSTPTSAEAPTPASADTPAPPPAELSQQLLDLQSSPHRLELLQLGVDRRLLLNRKTKQKMFRVWLQGRWRKPLAAETSA